MAQFRDALFNDRRILGLVFFAILSYAIVSGRLFYLQIYSGNEFVNLSKNNRIRKIRISPPRGYIYDREGRLLADNSIQYDAVVNIEDINDYHDFYEISAHILKSTPEQIQKIIREYRYLPYVPVVLKKDIDIETITRIEESKNFIPPLKIEQRPLRKYLFDRLTCHLIGYVGQINQNEWEKLNPLGFDKTDAVGKMGLEALGNVHLHGKSGGMQVQIDSRGFLDKVLSYKEPEIGQSLSLSIDIRLQEYIRQSMENWNGACVLINCRTGEILSSVSLPDFDPNIFVGQKQKKEVLDVIKNPYHPMINRAFSGIYPPGSIFKIVLAIAALSEDIIQPDTLINCKGVYEIGDAKFHCWNKKGHGLINIHQAIRYSCNPFFIELGIKLGRKKIIDWAKKFGFGELVGDHLWNEKSGIVPSREQLVKSKVSEWNLGDTINISLGQGFIAVTPLQIAHFMGMIANQGLNYSLSLNLNHDPSDKLQHLAVKNDIWKIIHESMFDVVNAEDGTGKQAKLESVFLAGKTGTVQRKSGNSHLLYTWFGGFAPVNDPEIAIAVVLEGGVSGGRSAAPIAKKILDYYFDEKNNVRLKANLHV